ncbi:MAG: metallophosphoesterase [Caldilineaceae bacterium]|nr:metallophosphoesterase [Caldilineaceae bacterium]HRJ40863.1 metallophosphoesterase family protein [Caldilineaceae bacterium]
MRVLIISDIHANFIALESVLAAAQGKYDAVWCLGDVVGYGPMPNECCQLVDELADHRVIGNHDWAVLGRPGIDVDDFNPMAREAVLWTRSVLTAPNRSLLENFPDVPVQPFGVPNLLLTHASPRQPVWEYVHTPTIALENFAWFDEPICLVGHTHKPAIYRWRLERTWDQVENGVEVGAATVDHLPAPVEEALYLEITTNQRLILNPGSVGQPRDNDPRAAYAFLDTELMTWELCRTPYPIDLTQSQMRAAHLPRRLIDRLSYGW